jgi:hypothetical protein
MLTAFTFDDRESPQMSLLLVRGAQAASLLVKAGRLRELFSQFKTVSASYRRNAGEGAAGLSNQQAGSLCSPEVNLATRERFRVTSES